MRNLYFLTLILLLQSNCANGQNDIDSLSSIILDKLDQYECLQFVTDKTLNDDAHQYDTAYFYHDESNKPVYIKWSTRSHTYYISGDAISITELFFQNGQVVLRVEFGYRFLNPQWHLEPDINETPVYVVESTRRYFKEDGTAIMDYESRQADGKYKDRFTILDAIPLEEVERLIWTDRCDKCIEEDYLSVYRKLLEEKGKE